MLLTEFSLRTVPRLLTVTGVREILEDARAAFAEELPCTDEDADDSAMGVTA